ncbi:MAG TPA: DUF3667 domain-containing protein [Steroidobacteraceae bacterium]|nr:DUF3667 domain-containing protein [Steroidobacteraceae bacterium]
MSSPPVPVVSPPEPPQPLTLVCANCHASLDGEYCSACGQRHEPHIHTVAHFAGEAFESISHADSRLWRTLWYLLARPGFLTREFFRGKRVSYLPPFRLYLVISVVFFLVVGTPEGVAIDVDEDATAERIENMYEAAEALEEETGPGSEELRMAASRLREQADREKLALESGETVAKPRDGLASKNVMTDFCAEFSKPDPNANQNYAKLHSACAKIAVDDGRELAKTVAHNIPRAMFLFLPLLALSMKPLYWRPKRYYVEHLLFLIHNHAFVFLVLTLIALLELIPRVGDHLGIVKFAAWVYMAWYLFRGMRNYYGQGRALTFAKYLTIGLSYISAAVMVLVLLALYSAISLG